MTLYGEFYTRVEIRKLKFREGNQHVDHIHNLTVYSICSLVGFPIVAVAEIGACCVTQAGLEPLSLSNPQPQTPGC